MSEKTEDRADQTTVETGDAIEWTAADARSIVRVPRASDDKYRRGVLGVQTGSNAYPGAAVLGVDAAARTGVGMIRYLGPDTPTRLVLHRRPEVVTAAGRVQAWLLGSGIDAGQRSDAETASLRDALGQGVPCAIDAGALDLVLEAGRDTIITPHAGELASLWARAGVAVERATISDDPVRWARTTANRFGVTVLLKGARTIVAAPSAASVSVTATSSWAATAGSGDVLGGILGALLATNAEFLADGGPDILPRVAATAAYLHQAAGARASGGGPITALDIAESLGDTIADLLRNDAD
ncbi:NAD(P)H-hydrate dehydratase [Agreia sp.]|uniref:ADP-dependent NAD(P)H-hydrate dehydratase n=1 Tax=Agreia sp. TaxID=1872416 RepID=UPI0035BC0828